MISDQRVEKALVKRAETDEEHAKLKAQDAFLDWQKKHKKGIFITTKVSDNLSFGVREQKWYASEDYLKHIDEQQDTLEKFLKMDNMRRHEKDVIDIWKTLKFERSQGNIK
jgi:hypothetical protein|tara:strand:+ start:168 stop:500 length:333 start_codon:yes stop_codon:yes gene_type:complete